MLRDQICGQFVDVVVTYDHRFLDVHLHHSCGFCWSKKKLFCSWHLLEEDIIQMMVTTRLDCMRSIFRFQEWTRWIFWTKSKVATNSLDQDIATGKIINQHDDTPSKSIKSTLLDKMAVGTWQTTWTRHCVAVTINGSHSCHNLPRNWIFKKFGRTLLVD